MESIPTPPTTQGYGIQDTHQTLLHPLDVLLERYLNLLDSYQTSRLKLTEALSSGYFFLAQANFKSSDSVRYGQDLYDHRMQASLKTDIRLLQTASTLRFSLLAASTLSATRSSQSQLLSKPLQAVDDSEMQSLIRNEIAAKSTRDPLNWFGILIPSALSTAQASFKSALNEAVSNLINISMEMQELEAEVEGLKHSIMGPE
ncbi:hypothetical protein MMC15_004476 [Xylographa vitiligo]|nr:hypothetical protein [Xylographa vitiligo]